MKDFYEYLKNVCRKLKENEDFWCKNFHQLLALEILRNFGSVNAREQLQAIKGYQINLKTIEFSMIGFIRESLQHDNQQYLKRHLMLITENYENAISFVEN